MTTSARQILLSLGGLLFCLAAFEATNADLLFQSLFFDAADQHWIWSRTEPVSRFLLYDGIKILLIAFALSLGACLLLARYSALLRKYSRGMRIVLLSMILVPACIGAGKIVTNVPCPRDIASFGGEVAHTGLVRTLFSSPHPASRYRCFPAGHASGGFALLSLFFLFQSARNRKRALYVGLCIGWTMGLYKIAIGDHFLSHTLVTMIIAWLITNLLVVADGRICHALANPKRRHSRDNWRFASRRGRG